MVRHFRSIRPSFIWTFTRDGVAGLMIGLANDGIAPVPVVLRLSLFSEDHKINVFGWVDAGYPSQPANLSSHWCRPRRRGRTGLTLNQALS
jgi:hypothetical protein